MGALYDFYTNVKPVVLYSGGNLTGDTYTNYVDTTDATGVAFVVVEYCNTADGSNYFTPTVKGYTGATPGTGTNYSTCAAGELDGAFAAYTTATTMHVQMVSLRQHLYKYYCLLLDETSTADSEFAVVALLTYAHGKVTSWSPTSGTVS